MANLYTGLQTIASGLISDFSQSDVTLVKPGAASGDAFNPTIGASTSYAFKSVTKGVDKKYVNGTTILATDLQMTLPVGSVEPEVGDSIVADSKTYSVIQVIRVPPHGTVIVYKVIIR